MIIVLWDVGMLILRTIWERFTLPFRCHPRHICRPSYITLELGQGCGQLQFTASPCTDVWRKNSMFLGISTKNLMGWDSTTATSRWGASRWRQRRMWAGRVQPGRGSGQPPGIETKRKESGRNEPLGGWLAGHTATNTVQETNISGTWGSGTAAWKWEERRQKLDQSTDPVHRRSHTRSGLGRDYMNLALPLQSAIQRGWFEPRTSWHKWHHSGMKLGGEETEARSSESKIGWVTFFTVESTQPLWRGRS
jgi:hypothetical protein